MLKLSVCWPFILLAAYFTFVVCLYFTASKLVYLLTYWSHSQLCDFRNMVCHNALQTAVMYNINHNVYICDRRSSAPAVGAIFHAVIAVRTMASRGISWYEIRRGVSHFTGPHCGTVWHLLCATIALISGHVRTADLDNEEHQRPAPLWRFDCDSVAVCNMLWLIYLLTFQTRHRQNCTKKS